MATKHTPGPWHIGDGSPESNYEGADCIIAKRSGAFTTLVKLNHYFGDESLANARLIAAAPDMLEAIVDYLEWGAMTSSDRDLFHHRFAELCKKAEGG